ncbi:hypothetical protein [Lignipirellula cremea]|uniref:hypothetical protein n=1 Tax=Lignipirellula cremea TaxID=2528010 RepID=UPI0011A07317|nr:hypothetical protein [Lignipirellula cremea]
MITATPVACKPWTMDENLEKLLENLFREEAQLAFESAKVLALSGNRQILQELYLARERAMKGSDQWGDAAHWRRPLLIERVIISLLTVAECVEAVSEGRLLDDWHVRYRISCDPPVDDLWGPSRS